MNCQSWKPCRRTGLICLGLAFITLALYLPTLWHDFLNYDDQQYVTENWVVRAGLTGPGFLWAFGNHAGNWHPLAWLSHMLDCQLYGLRPWGHHLTNLLLHTANTLLLFLLLQRLTGAAWRSAAVAALFAWHPLHVESVAWVAERKDVLSVCLGMLTLLAYARYATTMEDGGSRKEEEGRAGGSPNRSSQIANRKYWYFLSLVLFALGLMSKPMLVTLPFVMLLLDFWPLRRLVPSGLNLAASPMNTPLQRGMRAGEDPANPFNGLPPSPSPVQSSAFSVQRSKFVPLLLEKLPFLLLTLLACFLTVSAQRAAMASTTGLGVPERLEHMLLAYTHYLGALLFPHHLAVYYPYEHPSSALAVASAFCLLAGLTLLIVRQAARRPYLAVGWFWFLGTLVPVIGLVQVGDQAWADRYTYLPSIGFFIALVWALAELGTLGRTSSLPSPAPAVPKEEREVRRPTSGSLSSSGGAGRGEEARFAWSSRLPLRAALPWLAAGAALALLVATSLQLRYWKNTRTLFERTALVTRHNPLAITLLGSLLDQEGHLEQAIEHYRTALTYYPAFPEAHFFLGHAFEEQGHLEQAIAEYQQALWYKPIQEQTHIFLGSALAKLHQPGQARAHYLAALQLNPQSAVAHNNLARLLHAQGKLDDAISHYATALKLDPSLAQAHNNLGVLLLQQGRVSEGVAQLREALRLKPADPESELNLAQGLVDQQQWKEAADLFTKHVTAATTDPNVQYRFALALARLGRTREAMSHYASALLLQPDFAAALDGLSWILATAPEPQFRNGDQAYAMATRACELTQRQDPEKLKTLAAAGAETGRFSQAVFDVQAARDLALHSARADLADECRRMLEQFQAAKPWRVTP